MTHLVEIRGLNIRFTGERTVHAVNDLSLVLGDGEVLGLLGESGSGKSVTLRALMRLLPKKRTQISGSVEVLGRNVLALDDEELSAFRGQAVSMIFQEPALALDPVFTIGRQIAETVMRHEGKSQADAMARALQMLEVDRHGFDEVDRKLLLTIIEKYQGGPVGVNTLAAALAEESDAIEEIYEPFLIQIGFLNRTPRGRVATQLAYEHFGITPNRKQSSLF